MAGFKDIPDFRFEGRDNVALTNLIQQFQSGEGARAFGEAAHAVRELAASLAETDDVLRSQLASLGIHWQGAAGDNANKQVVKQAEYASHADNAGQQASGTVMNQSESYSHTRNSMPEPAKLQGDTKTNFIDGAAGFFGHETDHAKQVKETNAARQQTIDGLNGYVASSRDALDQYQGLQQPPNYDVTTTSSVSSSVNHVATPSVGTPTIHGGVPGSANLPGAQNLPGGQAAPGVGNAGPQAPQLPGNSSGFTPVTPGSVGGPAGPALPKPAGSNLGLGIGIGAAAGAGLGAVAATARGGKVVRGGAKGAASGGAAAGKGSGAAAGGGAKGGAAGAAKGGASGTIGAGAQGKGASSGIGAIEEETGPNRTGAAAAKGGKAGAGSLMQPAAAGRGKGEDDDEHVRKYGVDSGDVFGDERMVVQSVIGDDLDKGKDK